MDEIDIDIDEIVAALRERINVRRQVGDYPPGMEEQLEAEFVQIMRAVHRDELGVAGLSASIGRVWAATNGVQGVASLGSKVPGGSAVHAAAARVVVRHTNALAEQIRGFGSEVTQALQEVQRLFEVQRDADQRQLTEVVAAVIDRLAVLDHLADAVVDLERRVDTLERGG